MRETAEEAVTNSKIDPPDLLDQERSVDVILICKFYRSLFLIL